MNERNWAGNVDYGTGEVLRPGSLDELSDAVRRQRSLRVVGTRHSFSDIVRTDGALLSLDRLPTSVTVDPSARTATVTGSLRSRSNRSIADCVSGSMSPVGLI